MPQHSSPGSSATPWAICDELFTMHIPAGWHYRPEGYTDGVFDLPDGQALACHIESFEVPEAIANGGLMDFIREPGLDIPPLEAAHITDNVLMFIESPTGKAPSKVVWKSVGILNGTHVRVVRFSMPFDPATDGTPSPEEGISGEATMVINQGRFADHATPLDRVAPTKDLKRIAPWGVIHIRVPEFWRYERVEDGRYVCDVLPEHMPPDPTLWFDFDQFSIPPGETGLVERVREAATDLAATLGSPDQVRVDHDEAGSWVESVSHGHDGETPLIEYAIHRLVAGDACMVIAHFKFVLTMDEARMTVGQELTTRIYQEIRNAIVLPRSPDEKPPGD